MIMQESSVILIIHIFRFYKTQNFSPQMSRKYNIWGSRSTKIQNIPELRPAPLQPPNPPGVSSLASLGRKDISLRSDLPPQLNNAGFVADMNPKFCYKSGGKTILPFNLTNCHGFCSISIFLTSGLTNVCKFWHSPYG